MSSGNGNEPEKLEEGWKRTSRHRVVSEIDSTFRRENRCGWISPPTNEMKRNEHAGSPSSQGDRLERRIDPVDPRTRSFRSRSASGGLGSLNPPGGSTSAGLAEAGENRLVTLALPSAVYETARRLAEQSHLTIAALCERLVVEALTARDNDDPIPPSAEARASHGAGGDGEHELAAGAFSEQLAPPAASLPIWDQPGATKCFESMPAPADPADEGTTETPRLEADRETAATSLDDEPEHPDSGDVPNSSPLPPEAAEPIAPPAWIGSPPLIHVPQAPPTPPSVRRSDPPPITWRLPGEDEPGETEENQTAPTGSTWARDPHPERAGSNLSIRVILTPEDSDDGDPIDDPASESTSPSPPSIEFDEAPMTPSGDELEWSANSVSPLTGHLSNTSDPPFDRGTLRAIELVLRHAGPGARDPLALLPALRRGDMIPPQAARDLLDALRDLEHALAGQTVLERRLAFALHRLAFEGQILLTDADHWRGGVETEVVEFLRMVQEAVDRVISGQDIRYYQAD